MTYWVKRLLIANTAVYLLMALGALPADWAVLHFGFSTRGLLRHPWSPFTYMFLHGGFWHLFFNMLALFFFGPPLERKWGSRFFLRFYLVAGLGGALLSLPLYPLIGSRLVIGASGAVFGLLLAFAMNWPDAPIYIWGIFPIQAKWFVSILGAFALYATLLGGRGNVADWAHLGGLATGFLYLRYGERMGRSVERLLWKEKKRASHLNVQRGAKPPPRRRARRPKPGADEDALDRVDRILDKIREHGMQSLSAEETAFLEEMSRRYRRTP
ncbi:MAG: rhomboid family intramembrane serine protease [Gemmatimonadota bacterium]